MTRYAISKPVTRCYDLDEGQPAPVLPHPTVFVPEPAKTGLVDKYGNPIVRVPDAIGFVTFARTFVTENGG